MKGYHKFLGLSIIFFLCLFGCETYHMTTQSLLTQFADAHPDRKISVIVVFPFFFPGSVNGNDLTKIRCLNKKGVEYVLPVTNHTGVRITKKDSTRSTFYFNTLQIHDSILTGCKSHFLGGFPIRPILLKDIAKIELQQ